jgi:transmembrane sensor
MSNLVHLPNTRRVREEAAAWIVCLEEGLSDQQMGELKSWLAADEAHRAALISMAEQWDSFDALSELAEILPLRTESARTNRFAMAGVALVAVAVGALAVSLHFAFLRSASPGAAPSSLQIAANQPAPAISGQAQVSSSMQRRLRTDVGQHLTEKMPDGSSIALNTNTVLTVQFSQDQRLVILERGEASFSVAHDVSRPFRVKAGERTVQAVGTVFNVRRDEGRTVRVTVTEGVVKVIDRPEAKRGELLVRAGQLAEIGEASANIQRVDSSRLDAAQAWQRGVLIYQGETLEDVIADVSRYTSVRFEIEDDSIRQRRVGGVFRAGDVEGLLLALRETFGIEPRRQGDKIVLSAKE